MSRWKLRERDHRYGVGRGPFEEGWLQEHSFYSWFLLPQGPESPVQGPRIKHVCRHAAVALGQARAMVPEDVPRLSALPLRDRQDLATEGRAGVLWGDLTAVSSLGQASKCTRSLGECEPSWVLGARWQVLGLRQGEFGGMWNLRTVGKWWPEGQSNEV